VYLFICLSLSVYVSVAKAEVESRLSSAQTALMLQEDTIHRADLEHKEMLDRLTTLERTVSVLESEKQQLQVTSPCLSGCLSA